MAKTINSSIDQEWEHFISSKHEDEDNEDSDFINTDEFEISTAVISSEINTAVPVATPIYISTKTKISYLNQSSRAGPVSYCIIRHCVNLPTRHESCGMFKLFHRRQGPTLHPF